MNPGCLILTVLLFTGTQLNVRDSDEVKQLKERIELLETKLKLAEKEIDLQKKEIELLKSKPNNPMGKQSLSDLLPEGTVLTGDFRGTNAATKGSLVITITERNKTKYKANATTKNPDGQGSAEASIEGDILGDRLTWKTVGSATKINATLTRKNDGLEGTYSTSGGEKGTVALKIQK